MSIKTTVALSIALATALLGGLSAPAPRAAAQGAQPAVIPPEHIGVVVRDPWYEFGTNPRYPAGTPNYEAQDRMGEELAKAGARWVRLEFIVQQGAGTFEEQIARNDYFIREVAPRNGLKVLGLLAFRLVDIDPRDRDHGLLSNTYLETTKTPYGSGVNQYMDDWLDAALAIMTRYQGQVAAYEVFNEPNRLAYVPPSRDFQGYRGGEGIHPERLAALHTKLYRCFKQNQCAATPDPSPAWRANVKLLVGGLHPRGSDVLLGPLTGPDVNQPVSDRAYLAALFNSAAFKGYRATYAGKLPSDGIGYHPYPAEIVVTVASVSEEVARITGRLDEARVVLNNALTSIDPNIDVTADEFDFWITEVGYNAGYGSQTVPGQALFLRTTFGALAARPDVGPIFWFKYEDFPGGDPQRWGLVRIPFTVDNRCPGGACYAVSGAPELRRPAFWTLRELAGLPVTRILLPMIHR